MRKVIFFGLLFLSVCSLTAQDKNTFISGVIKNKDHRAVPEAYVYLKNTSHYTYPDNEGKYRLNLSKGTYELIVSAIGYKEIHQSITIEKGEELKLDFTLEEDEETVLDDVFIVSKSDLTKVQESSFNVAALDTEKLHNSSLDISDALDKVSGVKVRRSGGMGSDYNVMLNGFTGNHVKYFIDGVPMEGMNSAFQINNIPVNMAKRVEVYKGVVPLNLGSDALGGAINIITDEKRQNFVEASYSYGSFNTHKSFVNGVYTSKKGFRAQLTAYQNYSDNDYKVDGDIVDLENNQYTGDVRRVRRFHDRYKNYTIKGRLGFVNTSFADQLLVDFTYGDEYDEIQHPAYMKIAFGQKYTTSKTLMPGLVYKKDDLLIENLDVSLTANYNFGKSKNIDDSNRFYNWLGEYIEKDAKGEFNYSRRHFKNENASVNANINYTLKEKHAFTLNNVLNYFKRKDWDNAEPQATDNFPSETIKDILGAGYSFKPTEDWSISAFSKYYYNQVKEYADPNSSGSFEHIQASTEDLGYGLAGSYFITENLQLKTSYEKAFRLPTSRELFGAGNDFELGNPDLKSESSDNFNLGLNYTFFPAKKHLINIDGSFIYRDIKDFIRQVPDPSDGVLKPGNEASVKNRGVDIGLTYKYDQLFSVENNLTYQDLRNKLKYKTGKNVVSTIYNDRIPNLPYLYGNSTATLYLQDLLTKKDNFSISYHFNYIHNFDYSYESYGGVKIPTQVAHDIGIDYSLQNGRYNFSFLAGNILDEKLYDNFSLEKPGRHFSIKFRYFLDQFN